MSQPALSTVPRRLNVLAALALAGAGVSVWLTQHYYDLRTGSAGFSSVCNLGGKLNCDVVTASRYSEFFAGLPISSFATGWFVALFAVALLARDAFWRRDSLRAALLLTSVGLAASLSYFSIMAGVLKAFCLFCLIVDAVVIASFGIVLSLKPEGFKTHKPDLSKWKTLAGVTIASVLVSVGVLKGALDSGSVPAATVEELATSVLNSPVLPVGSGPELPSIGPSGAPITIVEFSDFQCPFCRIGAFTLNAVADRYPGKVRIVFRNFPLDSTCNRKMERSMHAYACEAARTAYCAHRQGKFEPVYESLFEHQTSFGPGKVAEFAQGAGVDAQQLASCVAAPEAASAVSRDIEEGIQLGIQSTPTIFINGRKVEGAYPPPVWGRIIDELLKQQAAR